MSNNVDESLHDYKVFANLFDFLNKELFGGRLRSPLITYSRRKGKLGYFWNNSYRTRANNTGRHEISMNPDTFVGSADKDIFATFLHEICHLWHQQFGSPGKNGYHTQVWANKMLEVGLQPISYDQPGKMTGYKLGHEIIQNGAFNNLIDVFLENPENRLRLESAFASTYAKSNVKHKRGTVYSCGCTNVKIRKNQMFAATCSLCGNSFKVVTE